MKPSGLLEAALYADDLEAAERFYVEVLGMDIVIRRPGRHVFFRCGDAVLLIFDPAETADQPYPGELPIPGHGAHGPGHVCFRASADEIDDWRARLEAAGVDIEVELEWPQGGRSIYFRDPAGNSLEFAEPRIWGLT